MLHIRQRHSASWLDTHSARRLSAELSERLTERTRGQRGLFVTLTYRREEWDDARELYRRSSEERHVRMFIRSLSRLTGEDYKGRWLCKLEFQRGGWIHYHILILGVHYIDKAKLDAAWEHGFTWINRATRKRIAYVCKYVAKGDTLPSWLLLERCRSVKIIRVSPGFWGDTKPATPPDPDRWRPMKLSAYVPIGTLIHAAAQRCVVRDPATNRITQFGRSLADVVMATCARGARVLGVVDGWLHLDHATFDTLTHATRTPGKGEARRAGGVHLIQTGNPHTPPWLERVLCDLINAECTRAC